MNAADTHSTANPSLHLQLKLHPEVLSEAQTGLLHGLAPLVNERGFYLAGGTAVALHLGHRCSIDFDWFSAADFDGLELARALGEGGTVGDVQTDRGTLHALVDAVRVSFFHYHYPLVDGLVEIDEPILRIAGLGDLACMKLAALLQRGERKDFYDLAAILETGRSLPDLFGLFERKYRFDGTSSLLRALTWFDDAEWTPDPVLLWPQLEWQGVKARLVREVREFAQR